MSIDVITVTCPGDNGRGHDSRPQIVQRFYRQEAPGRWVPATPSAKAERPEKQRRASFDRRGTPAGMTTSMEELKHDYACRLCGNSLQVGAGRWPRMEAALEALAAAGDSFTLDTLRRAYETSAPKQL